jgi:hypothetical protein
MLLLFLLERSFVTLTLDRGDVFVWVTVRKEDFGSPKLFASFDDVSTANERV